MPRLVRARLARLAQANFASMKCVVALALAFTARANESEVIQADVMASNGVIHVIDAVLMPPSDEEPTKGPTAMEESDSAGRASLAVAAAAAIAYVL